MKKVDKIIIYVILAILVLHFITVIAFYSGKQIEISSIDNNVRIVWHGVSVPIGYITLIRNDNNYGAMKLTNCWKKEWRPLLGYLIGSFNAEDIFANYEFYYQGDRSGDFSKKNVIIRKGGVSRKERFFPLMILSGHSTIPIGNPWIYCGPFKVEWDELTGKINYFDFYYDELWGVNRGIRDPKTSYELAPTKWTNISEINVFDPRIKWYKSYEVKDIIEVPIDKLWEEREQKDKVN